VAKALTTNKLIDSIIRRAAIPRSQKTFLTEDYLAFINEEMDLYLLPYILRFHEDYFLRRGVPIPLVSNQSSYNIPS